MSKARLLWVTPVIALVLLTTLQAAQLVRHDLAFTAVKTEVGFWGRETYHPTAQSIEIANLSLQHLLIAAPLHSDYLVVQANALAWQAYWAVDNGVGTFVAQHALSAQHAALKSRPAHRLSWAKMIEYATRTKGSDEIAQWARDKYAALAPGR